jgi:glutathione S-transferase
MKLCGHSVSPFVERILIALEMKGMPGAVPLADVPGGFKSDEHFSYHPLGKIPFLLLDNGDSLTESQVIVEYLDAVLDGPKLVPTDPMDAAKASRVIRILDIYYTNSISPMGRAAFGGDVSEEELANARDTVLPAALKYLDKCIDDTGFAVGKSWTHADAAMMSHFYWFEKLLPRYGVNGLAEYDRLEAYWEGLKKSDYYITSKARADAAFTKFFESKK